MSSLAEETAISLFDSYWYEYRIFAPKPPLHQPKTPIDLDQTLQEQEENQAAAGTPKLNPTMKKSFSDQFLSSRDCSPTSVLTPSLQTILSGKEFDENSHEKAATSDTHRQSKERPVIHEKRKRRRNCSRSLSELEFEEVKGFMDLGFVFSDEDKVSRLVSIIPGLQRLGKLEHVEGSDKGLFGDRARLSVSRPYLSEAWDCLEDEEIKKIRIVRNPLINWKISDLIGNEMEFKDHLRIWARTVASTVR